MPLAKPPLGSLDRSHPLLRDVGALWYLQEGSGSPRDVSRGLTATLNGGIAWAPERLELDGVDGWARVPDDPALRPAGEWTIACRARLDAYPTGGLWTAIVSKGGPSESAGDNHGWALIPQRALFTAGAKLILLSEDSSGSNFFATSSGSPTG